MSPILLLIKVLIIITKEGFVINLVLWDYCVGGQLLLLAYPEEQTMKSRITGTPTLEKGF